MAILGRKVDGTTLFICKQKSKEETNQILSDATLIITWGQAELG